MFPTDKLDCMKLILDNLCRGALCLKESIWSIFCLESAFPNQCVTNGANLYLVGDDAYIDFDLSSDLDLLIVI
jgi:hypothetical protein